VLRERYQALFRSVELPVPVESIAEDLLGLWIDEAEDLQCSGLLLPAERRIVLNAKEPASRKRFTLAHELGHWICQVVEGRSAPVFCRDSDFAPEVDRAREREANVFAAELLMPVEAVRNAFVHALSARELARWFGVSEEAMSWRLYNLDLADKPIASNSSGRGLGEDAG
jgi:Zn-dependent peptidase ImmA (M78 family)